MGINTERERAVYGEQSDQTGTGMVVLSVFTWTLGKAKSLLQKHTLQNKNIQSCRAKYKYVNF